MTETDLVEVVSTEYHVKVSPTEYHVFYSEREANGFCHQSHITEPVVIYIKHRKYRSVHFGS